MAPQVTEKTGWLPEEWTNLDFWQKNIHPDERESSTNYCFTCVAKGEPHSLEYRFRKKDGEYIWIRDVVSVEMKNNKAVTMRGVMFDITEKKGLFEELVVARDRAEESDRLKTAFLANMSHEIRTPMNAIMGFSSLLPDESDEDNIRKYAEIIEKNSEYLVHLIDDVMLYSKLQSKVFEYNPSKINIKDLFSDIKHIFEHKELESGIPLKTNIVANSTLTIHCDYDKLKQLLCNLISNSYKYTQKGFIELEAKKQDNEIVFTVSDTGIGIPENETGNIFERFFRASNVEQGKINGTGLGLSIVKELAGLLNGTIRVSSEQGKGTSFTITIPENS